MGDCRWVRQYLTDKPVILAEKALVSCHLTLLSSDVCPVSTCINWQCIQMDLLGLSQTDIDTQGSLLFSENSIGCQLNFATSSKWLLWFISMFTVIIPTIFLRLCPSVVEDVAQDTTVQIKGFWKFLKSTHLYINKNTRATALL